MTDIRQEEARATRYPLLAKPHVVLHGPVDHNMYTSFRQQLANAPAEGAIVVSISSLGGDPEVARLMGDALGWDTSRIAAETENFIARVEAERASQEEPDDAGADRVRLRVPDVETLAR